MYSFEITLTRAFGRVLGLPAYCQPMFRMPLVALVIYIATRLHLDGNVVDESMAELFRRVGLRMPVTELVQPGPMRLETHENVIAEPLTADVIARVVAGLTEVGAAYVILSESNDDETYLQAAGTVGEDFIVERRDGCAGEHYRGDRRVTADELVAMLGGCLHGATDWSHVVSWHQVRVDFGAANA